jgi:hypothetical protein
MGSIAYDRENTLQIKFKFNLRTDADIIEHLNNIENRQGYIKQLIRADIAAHGGNQEPTTDTQPGE